MLGSGDVHHKRPVPEQPGPALPGTGQGSSLLGLCLVGRELGESQGTAEFGQMSPKQSHCKERQRAHGVNVKPARSCTSFRPGGI